MPLFWPGESSSLVHSKVWIRLVTPLHVVLCMGALFYLSAQYAQGIVVTSIPLTFSFFIKWFIALSLILIHIFLSLYRVKYQKRDSSNLVDIISEFESWAMVHEFADFLTPDLSDSLIDSFLEASPDDFRRDFNNGPKQGDGLAAGSVLLAKNLFSMKLYLNILPKSGHCLVFIILKTNLVF